MKDADDEYTRIIAETYSRGFDQGLEEGLEEGAEQAAEEYALKFSKAHDALKQLLLLDKQTKELPTKFARGLAQKEFRSVLDHLHLENMFK